MKINKVEKILAEDKKRLMELVPTRVASSHDYTKIISENYDWYQIVINLSEKLSNSKKRARNHDLNFDLDLPYLAELWIDQKGRCALTGIVMEHEGGDLWDKNFRRFGIDRIDNSQGYIRENVRLTCHWSNNAKSTMSDNELKEFIFQAYDYMKGQDYVNS
jgi:hypothetical protein